MVFLWTILPLNYLVRSVNFKQILEISLIAILFSMDHIAFRWFRFGLEFFYAFTCLLCLNVYCIQIFDPFSLQFKVPFGYFLRLSSVWVNVLFKFSLHFMLFFHCILDANRNCSQQCKKYLLKTAPNKMNSSKIHKNRFWIGNCVLTLLSEAFDWTKHISLEKH